MDTGLHNAFVRFLGAYSDGVSDTDVKEHFQDKYVALPEVINSLVANGRLKLFQKGNTLSYQLVSEDEAEKLRGLGSEQILVLQEIEKAGNVGIWTRDLKMSTGLPQQVVGKALRALESRQLVKSVKSVSSKNKKLYMLYDLVPSREITGGPWYNEQEFDHAFIKTLSDYIFGVIQGEGMATLNFLTDKVRVSGISKVALGEEEILSIVNVLMYDGKIEEVRAPKAAMAKTGYDTNYKVSPQIVSLNRLTDVPCGVCPVFDECDDGNIISPASCVYMTTWLGAKEVKDQF